MEIEARIMQVNTHQKEKVQSHTQNGEETKEEGRASEKINSSGENREEAVNKEFKQEQELKIGKN